jgi:hypothetical protein
MKTFLLLMLVTLCALSSHAQNIITGIVMAENEPAGGVTVLVQGTARATSTNVSGAYSIDAAPGERIIFSYVGFQATQIIVGVEKTVNVTLLKSDDHTNAVIVAGSSANSWTGATLFYNFDGADLDNVVGAAKVKFNTAKGNSKWIKLNVIGNISKFTSSVSTTDSSKDLRQIAQSAQGLSVGLEPLVSLYHSQSVDVRSWVTANYKINSFQNVGPTEKSVGLSQGRFTVGAEFEGIEFVDGGKRLSLAVEGSATTFLNKQGYTDVFGTKAKPLYALEWSFVLPLFGNFGLLVGQTIAKGVEPAFSAGMVIASSR